MKSLQTLISVSVVSLALMAGCGDGAGDADVG